MSSNVCHNINQLLDFAFQDYDNMIYNEMHEQIYIYFHIHAEGPLEVLKVKYIDIKVYSIRVVCK